MCVRQSWGKWRQRIVHWMRAEGPILISDSIKRLQKQLDGLFIYCYKNLMVANEIKTRYLEQKKTLNYTLMGNEYRE